MINSFEDIKEFLENKNFKRIFILCGRNSYLNSGAENFFENIFKDVEAKVFFKKAEQPILEELIEIINAVKGFKPDLILAVGGGTVLDYSKIANVVDVRNDLKKLIVNYSYPFKKKYTRLAVIPTTAGSGAEITSNAVIYVDGIKYSFESDLLLPDKFFLVPEFLISAPNNIKASSGFDAIAQALESLISKKSNNMSVKYASESLKISIKSFNSFITNPNLKNAAEMCVAAHLAGKAISISKTTAPHAASYPFTSLFNISHGHAVSLFFEKFFEFNYNNIEKADTSFDLKQRFQLIFNLLEVKNINEFILKVSKIKKETKLEDDLKILNIDISQSSDKIINGINLLRLSNNPVKMEYNDIHNIISK